MPNLAAEEHCAGWDRNAAITASHFKRLGEYCPCRNVLDLIQLIDS